MISMLVSGEIDMVQVPSVVTILVDFEMSVSHSIVGLVCSSLRRIPLSHIFWPGQLEEKINKNEEKKVCS